MIQLSGNSLVMLAKGLFVGELKVYVKEVGFSGSMHQTADSLET